MSDSYKRFRDGEPVREQYYRSSRRQGREMKFKRYNRDTPDVELFLDDVHHTQYARNNRKTLP